MKNIFQKSLKVYISLFIFMMVNREFKPFGIDLRFAILPLGIIILIYGLIKNKSCIGINKEDHTGNTILLFYIIALVCNIAWIFNGISLNYTKFINEMILIINTFVGFLVIYFNKSNIDFKYIMKITVLSCIVLTLSIVLSYFGVPFEHMMGNPAATNIYHGNEIVNNRNIFGNNFRCAGYASDPNYATMLLMIGIVCVLKLQDKNRKTNTVLLTLLFGIGICLSFSRTIVIASLVLLIYIFALKKIKVSEKKIERINIAIVVGILLIVFIAPFTRDILKLPPTLQTRLTMWDQAKNLFFRSPIIGNGITSFRSYFEITHPFWYVQCHSTIWQVLSEIGIIGIMLYSKTAIHALNNKRNNLSYFITLLFLIWCCTCETIALPLSLFPLYIFELENWKEENEK